MNEPARKIGNTRNMGTQRRSLAAGKYRWSLILVLLVGAVVLSPFSAVAQQIRVPQTANPRQAAPNPRQAARQLEAQQKAAQLSEDCPKLLKWSQQLDHAYPDRDLFHSVITPAMVVPLFSEPNFVPYFGKPYEQLTPEERQTYWRQMVAPCFTATEYRRQFAWQGVALVFPFHMQGPAGNPLSPEQLIPALAALRQARSDLTRLSNEVAALPATADSYPHLVEMKKSAEKQLKLVWPSEQNQLNSVLTAGFARVSGPALAAKIDPLVSTAQGYDGLVALKRAPNDYKELFAAVTPDQRSEYQKRIDARSAAILNSLMNEEKAKVAKLGNGLPALKQGTEWYQAFQSRYVGQFRGPEIAAVLQTFYAKRQAQITAAEPELTQMIQQARTEQNIDGLLPQYLSLPEDHAVPGVEKLTQLASARKETLHKKEVLGTQAANRMPGNNSEPPANARPRANERPAHSGEPTSEDMYDAIQARVNAYNANMKSTITACKNRQFQNDPILAAQCLALFAAGGMDKYDFAAKITRFKKIDCASARAMGKPGYICDYVVGLSQNNPALTGTLGRIMESGEVTEARFVPLEKGWLLMPDTNH